MSTDALPPPLALLVRLIASATGSPSNDCHALAATLDSTGWAVFADFAIRRHMVAPLIAPEIEALPVPKATRAEIATAVRANAFAMTAQIAETKRVLTAFAEAGVPLTIVKGWPLGARLYPAPEIRHVGDLDLLVAPEQAAEALTLLEGLGFGHADGAIDKAARGARCDLKDPRVLAAKKHVSLVRAPTGVMIELHWRLMSLSGWPEPLGRPDSLARQETKIGLVPVLADRVNLTYLAVHGSLHAWSRLKWLADIALFAQDRGPAMLASDLDEARSARLARPLAFALSLSHRLLGSPLPETTIGSLTSAKLESLVLDRLARSGEPLNQRRYAADIRRLRLALASGWAQHIGVIDFDTLRRFRLMTLGRAKLPSD